MTHQEFCYWINGFMNLSDELTLSAKQVKIIQNHANLAEAVSGKLPEPIQRWLQRVQADQPIPALRFVVDPG